MLKRKGKKDEKDDAARSFGEICALTWESVYRYVYFRVQNREEAEDITQETYVKALSYLKENRLRSDLPGFLRSVALNILRDRWRRSKRQGPSVSIHDLSMADEAADDIAEQSAIRSTIRKALDGLGPEHRMVIELRIIKGYSTAETARIMNKKEGTVRVILYRALKKLAEILGAKL